MTDSTDHHSNEPAKPIAISPSAASTVRFESPFLSATATTLNTSLAASPPSGAATNFSMSPNSSRIQAGLPPLNFHSARRGSVSAESYNPRKATTAPATGGSPSTPNPQTSHDPSILVTLQNNFLFRTLDPEQLQLVMAALKDRPVPSAGETIIRQGDEGDAFYLVQSGTFAVEVNGVEVVQIGPGGSFGELALMYNAPRAATIRSLCPGHLLQVDRITFRRVIIDVAHEKRCKYMDFLRTVPLLKTLSDAEVGRVADALEPCEFGTDSLVIRQGDPGDAFYIILQGQANVIRDSQTLANTLGPGDYFGELALLRRQPRAATIKVAAQPLKCLRLGEADFVRLLGPLADILKRNQEQYEQYKQYLE